MKLPFCKHGGGGGGVRRKSECVRGAARKTLNPFLDVFFVSHEISRVFVLYFQDVPFAMAD